MLYVTAWDMLYYVIDDNFAVLSVLGNQTTIQNKTRVRVKDREDSENMHMQYIYYLFISKPKFSAPCTLNPGRNFTSPIYLFIYLQALSAPCILWPLSRREMHRLQDHCSICRHALRPPPKEAVAAHSIAPSANSLTQISPSIFWRCLEASTLLKLRVWTHIYNSFKGTSCNFEEFSDGEFWDLTIRSG